MKHIMIDLETLDLVPTSVILSIGAVVFDEYGLVLNEELYLIPDAQEQLDGGRTVSFDVLKWWITQNKKAKEVFNQKTDTIFKVAYSLFSFLDKHKDCTIWANGPQFDISMIENFLKQSGYSIPYKFNKVRDFRTACDTLNGWKSSSKTVSHNALQDAKDQAIHLIDIWKKGKVT